VPTGMNKLLVFFGVAIMLMVLSGCAQQGDTTMGQNPIATVTTSMGTFKIELAQDKAPQTAKNFADLAEKGFYDGIVFHRIIPNFMIQGGDPNGDGTGGPGYEIPDEFHVDLSNVRGTISMANRGPNTGGSQFFINLVDNQFLDHDKPPAQSKHAVFGHVIEGMDVVDAIAAVPTGAQDRPIEPVTMISVTIAR